MLSASDYIAIAALILSVVFPLVIRAWDRRASRPNLNLHVYHSHVLDPAMYPEVFDALLASNVTVMHMDRRAEHAGQGQRYATQMIVGTQQYHMFTVVVENRSTAPCTLTDLRVVNMSLAPPPVPENVVADTVYGHDDDSQRWEVNPLVSLEPSQSRRLKFVVGFAVFPDEEASKEIEAAADRMFIERSSLSGSQTNAAGGAISKDACWLAAHSDYVSHVRLAAVEFAMRDNFGKWWYAEPTKLKGNSSDNESPLTECPA